MQNISKNDITAVILAGGRSSRMDGLDKGLILLNNKPLISYVVKAIDKKVINILISANRNLNKYKQFGEVITDDFDDFQGPLAGITKAITNAKTPYLLVVPCDSPLINSVLVERLSQFMQQKKADICIASDGLKTQPVFALIKTNLKDNLLTFMHTGKRKLMWWIKGNKYYVVLFPDYQDMFINLNEAQNFNDLPLKNL